VMASISMYFLAAGKFPNTSSCWLSVECGAASGGSQPPIRFTELLCHLGLAMAAITLIAQVALIALSFRTSLRATRFRLVLGLAVVALLAAIANAAALTTGANSTCSTCVSGSCADVDGFAGAVTVCVFAWFDVVLWGVTARLAYQHQKEGEKQEEEVVDQVPFIQPYRPVSTGSYNPPPFSSQGSSYSAFASGGAQGRPSSSHFSSTNTAEGWQ